MDYKALNPALAEGTNIEDPSHSQLIRSGVPPNLILFPPAHDTSVPNFRVWYVTLLDGSHHRITAEYTRSAIIGSRIFVDGVMVSEIKRIVDDEASVNTECKATNGATINKHSQGMRLRFNLGFNGPAGEGVPCMMAIDENTSLFFTLFLRRRPTYRLFIDNKDNGVGSPSGDPWTRTQLLLLMPIIVIYWIIFGLTLCFGMLIYGILRRTCCAKADIRVDYIDLRDNTVKSINRQALTTERTPLV